MLSFCEGGGGMFREVVMGTVHAQGGGALLLGIELHGVVCNLAVLSGCDKDHFYIVVVRVTPVSGPSILMRCFLATLELSVPLVEYIKNRSPLLVWTTGMAWVLGLD